MGALGAELLQMQPLWGRVTAGRSNALCPSLLLRGLGAVGPAWNALPLAMSSRYFGLHPLPDSVQPRGGGGHRENRERCPQGSVQRHGAAWEQETRGTAGSKMWACRDAAGTGGTVPMGGRKGLCWSWVTMSAEATRPNRAPTETSFPFLFRNPGAHYSIIWLFIQHCFT